MTLSPQPAPWEAKCVARVSHRGTNSDEASKDPPQISIVDSYRSLQWSADGTCLIGTDSKHSIRTFVVPVDLLEPRDVPHSIDVYCAVSSTEPISAVAGVPFFDLQTPSTALVLSSQRDHPLRLTSALTGERVAAYPLINPLTEAYICPKALTFSLDGRHIIAGSESLISIFDITCTGQGPSHSIQTGPKKLKDDRWNPSTSVRGVISTLDVEPSSNMLATGTFSRQIGLYEAGGVGECVAALSVTGNAADTHIHGGGITQIKWSPCGRYLYIAERKSTGIMLYDIRKTHQLLSWCEGRNARTNQRLAFDVVTTAEGNQELWAGGTDGSVKIWENVHQQENAVPPFRAVLAHEDPISGLSFHRSGGVFATASGQDYFSERTPRDEEVDGPCALKIWTVDDG